MSLKERDEQPCQAHEEHAHRDRPRARSLEHLHEDPAIRCAFSAAIPSTIAAVEARGAMSMSAIQKLSAVSAIRRIQQRRGAGPHGDDSIASSCSRRQMTVPPESSRLTSVVIHPFSPIALATTFRESARMIASPREASRSRSDLPSHEPQREKS